MNGRLVSPDDTGIFADEALRILNDDKAYEKLRNGSLKLSLDFSQESQAAKLIDIYNRLIAEDQ